VVEGILIGDQNSLGELADEKLVPIIRQGILFNFVNPTHFTKHDEKVKTRRVDEPRAFGDVPEHGMLRSHGVLDTSKGGYDE
jgi:hypothetical protein